MNHQLIESETLSQGFLNLMGASIHKRLKDVSSERRSGALRIRDLDNKLQSFIKLHSKNSALIGDGFYDLFHGCTKRFDGDHSKSDFALIQIIANSGFTKDQCDQILRASGLYRAKWDSNRGDTTYGWQTIDRVFDSLNRSTTIRTSASETLSLVDFVPRYIPGGMSAREFVGPKIATGAHLFPKNALSAMVALGGGGKTSSIIALSAHIAGGQHWKGHPVKPAKVMVFSVEETQDELNRKFSAIVDLWPATTQELVISNLRLVSLQGVDARLIRREFGENHPSEWPEQISNLACEFGIDGDGLIFLDHYQGFATGDLNTSDTATAICREGNKIVAKTGAAVVFTAHIPKSQINNNQLNQGMASGSLAFENAMRQVVVLLPMSDEEAKKYDMHDDQRQYVKLGFTKNSYGTTDAECWLRKVHVPAYHTIRIQPVDLITPIPQARRSANDKLGELIVKYIRSNPYVSKNMIDRQSGKDGPFAASKEKCRDVLKGLIDADVVHIHQVTGDERRALGIPKQVTEVLRVS